MIRTAWRLLKAKYVAHAFDGEGSRLYGGRWNSRGKAIAYLSETRALAALEVLVHFQDTSVLPSYSVLKVSFDDALVMPVELAALPANWRQSPPLAETQALGDAWVDAATSAILQVPSAVIDGERNYLINPAHADFHKIVIDAPVAFDFDIRLSG